MCERRPFEKQRGEASICTQSGAANDRHSDFGVKEIEVNLRCQAAGQTGLVLFDSRERERGGSIKICKPFACGEAIGTTISKSEMVDNNLEGKVSVSPSVALCDFVWHNSK